MSDRSHEDILATVLSKLAHLKRKAWKPIVREGEDVPASSKFGGTPVLCLGENWPLCVACQNPMRLCLQINSQDLPQTNIQLFGDGILQLFYCSSRKCDLNTDCPHYPINPRQLVRIIDRDNITSDVTVPDMPEDLPVPLKKEAIENNVFKPRSIVGWEEIDDYANFIDRKSMGFYLNDYNDDFEIDEDEEYNLAHDLCYPENKLLGWPDWSNYQDMLPCKTCGKKMKNLVFQIGGYDDVSWADGSITVVLQCSEHLDQVISMWGV
jgi:uncharacterized protein YwqG